MTLICNPKKVCGQPMFEAGENVIAAGVRDSSNVLLFAEQCSHPLIRPRNSHKYTGASQCKALCVITNSLKSTPATLGSQGCVEKPEFSRTRR